MTHGANCTVSLRYPQLSAFITVQKAHSNSSMNTGSLFLSLFPTSQLWSSAFIPLTAFPCRCPHRPAISPARTYDYLVFPSYRLMLCRSNVDNRNEHNAVFKGAPLPKVNAFLQERFGKDWIQVESMTPALNDNHLVSLLSLYGEENGLLKDQIQGSYMQRLRILTDRVIMQIANVAAAQLPQNSVVHIDEYGATDRRKATFLAMREGKHVIVGAVVANEKYRVRARIPIILRADVIKSLFNIDIDDNSISLFDHSNLLARDFISAHNLDTPPHNEPLYIAVAIRRRVFSIKEFGTLCRKGNIPLQAKLWLWSWLLCDVQGTVEVLPGVIVGMTSHKILRKLNSKENNGPLAHHCAAAITLWNECDSKGDPLEEACQSVYAALNALSWQMRAVDEGRQWLHDVKNGLTEAEKTVPGASIISLAKSTRDPKFRPNMQVFDRFDWPWTTAKRAIAEEIGEVTLIAGISRDMGYVATREGMNDFRDSAISASQMQIDKLHTESIWKMVKPDYSGAIVVPSIIEKNFGNWRGLQVPEHGFGVPMEDWNINTPTMHNLEQRSFYVDFELASPLEMLVDTGPMPMFSPSGRTPSRRDEGQDLEKKIFMVGCGRMINGNWKHRVFVANSLTADAEVNVIDDWVTHMQSILPSGYVTPIVYVWGPEKAMLRRALSSRSERESGRRAAENMVFVDLKDVIDKGRVVVKGMLTKTLKSISEALQVNGLVDSENARERFIANGADAMALGLAAADYGKKNNVPLIDTPQIHSIIKYNECDCRDIVRILYYLRKNH